MNTIKFRVVAASLALMVAASGRADTLVLLLPPGVAFASMSSTGATTELRVSGNVLAAGIGPLPGASIQVSGDACVISLPTAGAAYGLRVTNVASGPFSVTVETSPVAGGAPATSAADVTTVAPVTQPTQPATAPTIVTPAAAAAPSDVASAQPSEPPASPNPTLGGGGSVATPGQGQGGGAGGSSAATPPATAPALSWSTVLPTLLPDATPIAYDPLAKADYTIPESTAATAIGAGNPLVRPSTPREVVTSLLTNFDDDGKLQAGFSLAVTPYTLLRKMPLTADEYREPGKRFLANLQVSIAGRPDSKLVTNGTTGARASVGLSMVFFDRGDLRLDNEALGAINQALAVPASHWAGLLNQPGQLPELLSPAQLEAAKKVWDERKAAKWNASSAGAGVAPAFLTRTGELQNLEDDGVMVWASYSGAPGKGGLADSFQFIFGGNARFGQKVENNAVWTRMDVVDLGAQLRYGAAGYNFFAQGQYRQRSYRNAEDAGKFVYEIGLEKRLAQGLWLNLALTNDEAVKGGSAIRSGLRYGFGTKPALALGAGGGTP